MKRLPHSMLARFTQIDYDRHIALVALSLSNSQESMLGVARVILAHNPKEAEFSIIVGDPWQGKGIGAALLSRCISIAKERGIQKVMGAVLAENTQMLALGKKLGFKINGKSSTHELAIDLLNVTNRENFLTEVFVNDPDNPGEKEIRPQPQLGFLPLLYYKVDF